MNITFQHIPVMCQETIHSLHIKKNGIYIDGTFGMGGHSSEILKKLGNNGQLYSIDKDPESIKIGKKINDNRFHIQQNNFSKILHYAQEKEIVGKVNGIIFDLGVSSPQINNAQRGFSFILDGPLDMRMNPYCGISASDWLFKSTVDQIAYVLKTYGEERFSKKIAYNIKKYNKYKKITRTLELSNIIQMAIPIKNKFKHPARRTFQAIRIYINQELEEVHKGLKAALKILKPGGYISIISFHSLEDRIVKNFMINNSTLQKIPYGIPITEKKRIMLKKCQLKNIKRIFPSLDEIKKNPRARSAILRTAEIKNNEI
ncbi:16S rRNA (cytosine(1402)-N(4))-methyltransferase RsmH [Buchnera aphidicola]|uniref:16S rRNA (cytosine(1402)-N(4))-methyltransferase RsmH n=1 Tax=Buchnera aphidicola TaxID=9 RepID=UPI003BEF2763